MSQPQCMDGTKIIAHDLIEIKMH